MIISREELYAMSDQAQALLMPSLEQRAVRMANADAFEITIPQMFAVFGDCLKSLGSKDIELERIKRIE